MAHTDNVVGFWDLDNDSVDDSGNGKDGTDTSMSYDGTSGTFNGSAKVATTVTNTFGDFTVAGWITPTGSTAFERVFDKIAGTGFWVGRNADASASFGGGVVESFGGAFRIYASLSNALHHIVVTRSGTTHSLYVDAASPTTQSVNSHAMDTAPFILGNRAETDSGFHGSMRCAAIYSVAKDATWVTEDYNSGTPKKWADWNAATSHTHGLVDVGLTDWGLVNAGLVA